MCNSVANIQISPMNSKFFPIFHQISAFFINFAANTSLGMN